MLTDRTSHAFMSAASQHREERLRSRRVMEASREDVHWRSVARQAVGTAATMSSDYDRAESLIALGRAPGVGPSTKKALRDAASAMHGDYDRGRVLEALSSAGIR